MSHQDDRIEPLDEDREGEAVEVKSCTCLCKLRIGVFTPAAGLLLIFWQSAYALGTALQIPSSRQGYYVDRAHL